MVNWDYIDAGSILGLLGDIDPLDPNTNPDDLLSAQEYLLNALHETFRETADEDDWTSLQDNLWDLASLCTELNGHITSFPLPLHGPWVPVKDGDTRARALFERHYSANLQRRHRHKPKQFVGPGQKLVLLTPTCDALFVWRLERFRQDQSYGANCAVFRNESQHLASDLILHAETWARLRWPFIPRLFTFVHPAKVRSTNPGYCFKIAGYRHCATTKSGLLQFEKLILPLGCQLPWTTPEVRHAIL